MPGSTLAGRLAGFPRATHRPQYGNQLSVPLARKFPYGISVTRGSHSTFNNEPCFIIEVRSPQISPPSCETLIVSTVTRQIPWSQTARVLPKWSAPTPYNRLLTPKIPSRYSRQSAVNGGRSRKMLQTAKDGPAGPETTWQIHVSAFQDPTPGYGIRWAFRCLPCVQSCSGSLGRRLRSEPAGLKAPLMGAMAPGVAPGHPVQTLPMLEPRARFIADADLGKSDKLTRLVVQTGAITPLQRIPHPVYDPRPIVLKGGERAMLRHPLLSGRCTRPAGSACRRRCCPGGRVRRCGTHPARRIHHDKKL